MHCVQRTAAWTQFLLAYLSIVRELVLAFPAIVVTSIVVFIPMQMLHQLETASSELQVVIRILSTIGQT